MRFIRCLLAIAFTLPLLAASDVDHQDVQRRDEGVKAGGLKGSSSERANEEHDEEPRRQLTWASSWWNNHKKKNNKTKKGAYYSYPSYNNHPSQIGSKNNNKCKCNDQWKKFEFTAYMGNAIASASSVNEIGGKYVYNGRLAQNAALTEPYEGTNSAYITGECTRFQDIEITTEGNRILGAGLCTFIMSVVTPRYTGSMILQGELFDVIPTVFAITGGTGDFDGARGKVQFMPFYDNEGTDVFTESSHVMLDVDARVLDKAL